MSGVRMAAIYGFYPHRLGLCGKQGKLIDKVLFAYLSGNKVYEQKAKKILKTFRGAFSYYKLIAKSNRIKDPFNKRVVAAYWLGNDLLEKVHIEALKEMIKKEFVGPGLLSKKEAEEKISNIPLGSKPHHSFHVLVVGSVSGQVNLEGKLLDACRIGWGKVIETKNKKTKKGLEAIIEYQPLEKRGGKYFLGKLVKKSVFWDKEFLSKIETKDWVAIHWDHIVQVLNKENLLNLKKYTCFTLNSLNSFKTL